MSWTDQIGRCVMMAIAWIALGYLFLPLLVIVGASFTASGYLTFPPQGLSVKGYAAFLSDPSYLDAFWVSTQLASASMATALVLGIPAALALARSSVRGRRFASGLFLSPLVLPHLVAGAALLQFASAAGFARSFFVLYVGHTVIVLPYVIRTVLPALGGAQRSMEEASQDLGAGAVATFFLVTLPQIKPHVVAGAFFAFIVSWINVELSIFNTKTGLETLPVKVFNYVQYTIDPMIAAVAASTIFVAIVVVAIVDASVGLDRVGGAR